MAALRVKSNTHTYMFKNSEKLTLAINFLYSNRSTRYLKSELYMLNKKYYLTVSKSDRKLLDRIEEFSDNTVSSNICVPILKEYGNQLIEKEAIRVYGKAFSKYF